MKFDSTEPFFHVWESDFGGSFIIVSLIYGSRFI